MFLKSTEIDTTKFKNKERKRIRKDLKTICHVSCCFNLVWMSLWNGIYSLTYWIRHDETYVFGCGHGSMLCLA